MEIVAAHSTIFSKVAAVVYPGTFVGIILSEVPLIIILIILAWTQENPTLILAAVQIGNPSGSSYKTVAGIFLGDRLNIPAEVSQLGHFFNSQDQFFTKIFWKISLP